MSGITLQIITYSLRQCTLFLFAILTIEVTFFFFYLFLFLSVFFTHHIDRSSHLGNIATNAVILLFLFIYFLVEIIRRWFPKHSKLLPSI